MEKMSLKMDKAKYIYALDKVTLLDTTFHSYCVLFFLIISFVPVMVFVTALLE